MTSGFNATGVLWVSFEHGREAAVMPCLRRFMNDPGFAATFAIAASEIVRDPNAVRLALEDWEPRGAVIVEHCYGYAASVHFTDQEDATEFGLKFRLTLEPRPRAAA